MTSWYYVEAGQTRGPVDDDGLRALARQGTLGPDASVMPVGSQTWGTLAQHEASLGLQRDWNGRYTAAPVGAASVPPPPPGGMMPPPPPGSSGPWSAPPPGYSTPPGYGMAPAYGSGQPVSQFGRPLTSWGKRVLAAIIDAVVLLVPTWILLAAMGSFETSSTDDSFEFEVSGAPTLVPLLIGLVYFTLLHGSARGQTVGKMATRIQLRDAQTGEAIGYGRAFLRWLVITVLSIPCGIPALISDLAPLWDRQRQTWQDKAAGSVVVDLP